MRMFLGNLLGLYLVSLFANVGHCVTTTTIIPQNAEELRADFDPRKDPLETEIVREWEEDGGIYRYVIYTIATFKGVKAKMAAFYGFPKGETNLPALMHMHGGGQRAFMDHVKYYVSRGYACLSVNWGGRTMENAKPEDPNTDWGAVDPTQKNVKGYWNLEPGPKFIDDVESPRNNNWYLLTISCRRGLTFLEQQPEVDPNRLGIMGHSMGGNLTTYVAGTDDRIKVAVSSCGGQGFRSYSWPLLPQNNPIWVPKGNLEMFRRTIEMNQYAPYIKAPYLWVDATNDFHGIMDDVYRTSVLIPHDQVRYCIVPHLNHQKTPEFEATMELWFDQWLKGTPAIPNTPESELKLLTPDHVPVFTVTPDSSRAIEKVDIYYSIDPDPQCRFWRDARAEQKENCWVARCPIMNLNQPLFAFANVTYKLEQPLELRRGNPVDVFVLTSLLRTATPENIRGANVKATDKSSLLIDDFIRGLHDWFVLNANSSSLWIFSTRKLTDPKWRGPDGARLALDVKSTKENPIVFLLIENEWRSYRGKRKYYAAEVTLKGSEDWQTVCLGLSDFRQVAVKKNDKVTNDSVLSKWNEIDRLEIRPSVNLWNDGKEVKKALGAKWDGPKPEFSNMRWAVE